MRSWGNRFLPFVGMVFLASSFSGSQANLHLRHWITIRSISETSSDGISGSIDATTTEHSEKTAMSQAMLASESQDIIRRNAEEVVDEEEVVVVVGEEEEEGDDDDDLNGGGDDDDGGGGDDDDDDGGDDDDDDDNGESTWDVPLEENTQQALQDRYDDPPEERDSMGDSIFLPVTTNNIFEQEPQDDMENRTRIVEIEETPSHHHQGV